MIGLMVALRLSASLELAKEDLRRLGPSSHGDVRCATLQRSGGLSNGSAAPRNGACVVDQEPRVARFDIVVVDAFDFEVVHSLGLTGRIHVLHGDGGSVRLP